MNAIALFGSYATNKHKEDSDIDLLLEQKEVEYLKPVATLTLIQKKISRPENTSNQKGASSF